MVVMVVCFRTNARRGKINEGFFWRCPFWRSYETCNLFIWDEDTGENIGNEDESNMISELEVVGYLKVMYEDSKKKNKNLKNKLKSERFYANLKMLCFLSPLCLIFTLLRNVIVEVGFEI